MIQNAAPGCYIAVEVVDTGIGIPADLREKIFDPFFTTKGEGKGTGLGLATVTSIVKSHGGFLTMESEVGSGTAFRVYLPADLKLAPDVTGADESIATKGSGELILLVDDEANFRSMAKTVLENNDYRVIEASDGAEAIALYAQDSAAIAAVFTDIIMPCMDGVALLRAIRKLNPQAKVIASTGQSEKNRLAELKSLGVTALLDKPYSARTLIQTLGAVLHPMAG
jgi:CheY-like chemotaxis protein